MEKISIKPDWVFSPQPMYIIGTRNEDGTPNFCVITWIGFSYDNTPHLMMSIGGSKRTKTNILREKKFSAHMITEDTLFLAEIKNIQIAKEFETMDMQKIDLTRLKPAIYAPYQYFSIGAKLGKMGEWEKYLK